MEESRDQEPTGLTGSAHVLVVSFAHRRRLSLSWWTKIHLSVAWWNTNISWQIWLRVDKIRELVSKTIIYLVSFSVSLISLGSVVQYRLLMIVAIYKNDTRSMVHYIFFNVCDISKRMDMKNLFWILYSLHVLYRNVNIFQTNKKLHCAAVDANAKLTLKWPDIKSSKQFYLFSRFDCNCPYHITHASGITRY